MWSGYMAVKYLLSKFGINILKQVHVLQTDDGGQVESGHNI